MRTLEYIIKDVRQSTDNNDTNGTPDREFVRYARDFVRSVQAIVYKNNPLCAYFQGSFTIDRPICGEEYDLPEDVYAQNAVTFVEYRPESSVTERYSPLDRVWPEDQNNYFGYFIRNKKIVFTGGRDTALGYSARIWYFKRSPMWDIKWAKITTIDGNEITLDVFDADMFEIDSYVSILDLNGNIISGIKYTKTADDKITLLLEDMDGIYLESHVLMGKNACYELDFPEECETYALDYIAKRIVARNDYGESMKAAQFSDEAKSDLIAIFADASQTQNRAPMTDTDFLRI